MADKAKIIKMLRERKIAKLNGRPHYSQTEIAKICGCGKQYVNNIKKLFNL